MVRQNVNKRATLTHLSKAKQPTPVARIVFLGLLAIAMQCSQKAAIRTTSQARETVYDFQRLNFDRTQMVHEASLRRDFVAGT